MTSFEQTALLRRPIDSRTSSTRIYIRAVFIIFPKLETRFNFPLSKRVKTTTKFLTPCICNSLPTSLLETILLRQKCDDIKRTLERVHEGFTRASILGSMTSSGITRRWLAWGCGQRKWEDRKGKKIE